MRRVLSRSVVALGLGVGLGACTQPKTPEAASKPAPTAAAAPASPAAPGGEATPTQPAPTPAADGPVAVGNPAPDFSLSDLEGNAHKLSDYKGKTVVLEWFNPKCPFVKAAHNKGALKTMAAQETKKGVVWLAINSGAPGKQGHGVDKNTEGAKKFNLDHPILMDESGDVGRLYGAKKTPHMYLIDDKGTLLYRGAIDNAPFNQADGDYVNYLGAALADLRAGRAVNTAETDSWGCTVKYGKS